MPDVPQAIDIKQANDYITTNRATRTRMKTWIITEIDQHRQNEMNAPVPGTSPIPHDSNGFRKAENFFNDLSNTYIFRKEDFDRFFVGDSTDPHPNLKFTHCMIVIGALKDDIIDPITSIVIKNKGEQTILIAGCTQLKTDPTKYITTSDGTPTGLRLQKIAEEHPPKSFKSSIKDKKLKEFGFDETLADEYLLLASEQENEDLKP